MKKALIAAAFLGVFLAAGVASAHMMGRDYGCGDYGKHVRYSQKGSSRSEVHQKFLDESYQMRKDLHEKKFELKEALRLDEYGKADKLGKEVRELRSEIAKIADKHGLKGGKRPGDCRGPQTW